ncbi:hypothetical protein Tco_0606225, partial [Tanacetum coccineum]
QQIRRIHQLDTTYRPFHSEQRIDLQSKQCVAGEWFKKDCIGSVTTWENLVENFVQKFYQHFDHNEETESEEDVDPDDITNIFKIEGNLFDYETPLCKAFSDFNYSAISTIVWVENMTYFKDHKWYDELADGVLKDETLMHKEKVEESWGNATPGVMKFYAWLINSFGNFHELDYNVLVKLQECWWKINAHEVAPFTLSESYGQRPYAKFKTKKAHDPYLEINNIFGRNYDTSNAGTQDNQRHEECRDDPTLEPSVCKIRRFEMMKYSFNADEEYIAIKESEYLNHSKDNLDAYRELLHIINEG